MARRRQKEKRYNLATRMTLSAIMLFEFTAAILLVLRGDPLDWTAAILAVALPAISWISVRMASGRLKADVLLVMLMNFLCGLGVILLYGLSPERGIRQAWIYALGIPVFAICVMAVRLVKDWRAVCWLMMLGGITLLLLPVAIGQETNGAKNWFAIPFLAPFSPVSWSSCVW